MDMFTSYIMIYIVILGSQNENTDFFMILAEVLQNY